MSSGQAVTTIGRADLLRARRQAALMLTLAEGASVDELTDLGIDPLELDALRKASQLEVRELPSARNTVLGTFAQTLTKEMVLTGYARAQQAVHALAPLVVLRLAEKLDNDQAPGSTRILIELAKGLGLLAPAEAVTPQKRMAGLDLEQERAKPLDQLKNEILGYS